MRNKDMLYPCLRLVSSEDSRRKRNESLPTTIHLDTRLRLSLRLSLRLLVSNVLI
jgi:hypothetical protein